MGRNSQYSGKAVTAFASSFRAGTLVWCDMSASAATLTANPIEETLNRVRALEVRRLILHDVVKRDDGDDFDAPPLDLASDLPEEVATIVTNKLVRALTSRNAYELEFDMESLSPVPAMIKDYTLQPRADQPEQFADYAAEIARVLIESQSSNAVRSGVLAVIDGVMDGQRCLVLAKLERESGLRLETVSRQGRRVYSLEAVRNLVMTESTKLWKVAIFVRFGSDEDQVQVIGCDRQQGWGRERDMAAFWLGFLGCRLADRPSITTRRFYEAVVDYADQQIQEPEKKEEVYNHLLSQLRSRKETMSPESFAREFMPQDDEVPFLGYIEERGVPNEEFAVDTTAIRSKLKMRTYRTRRGARISAPVESESWLEVQNDVVIIRDEVVEVD